MLTASRQSFCARGPSARRIEGLTLAMLAVLCVTACVCGPVPAWAGPDSSSLPDWEEFEGKPPEWALVLPVKKGSIYVLDGGQSNRLSLAYGFSSKIVRPIVLRHVQARLRPVVGAKASSLRLTEPPTVAHRASCKDSEGYTAFVLWRVPTSSILDQLPSDVRDASAKALQESALANWKAVREATKTRPNDAPDAGIRLKTLELHTEATAVDEHLSRAKAIALGHSSLREKVIAVLQGALDRKEAFHLASYALSWSRLDERTSGASHPQSKPASFTARLRWRIPVKCLLERVPEARRAKVAESLRRIQPAGRSQSD